MKIRICAMFLTGFVWSTEKQIRICSNGMMPMLTVDTVNLPRMFRQWEILLHEGWLWKVSDMACMRKTAVSSASRNIEIFRTISEYHKYHVIFES